MNQTTLEMLVSAHRDNSEKNKKMYCHNLMVRGLLIAFQSILDTVKLINTQHKNIYFSLISLHIFHKEKTDIVF